MTPMLQCFKHLPPGSAEAGLEVVLSFEDRQRSRHAATMNSGQPVGWIIERGVVLRDGALLQAEDGTLVRVVAAPEALSLATSDDPLLLLRAAYHLGNRHVPVQIEPGRLSYQRDHVLDDMLRGLGLPVSDITAPFQPESGAYGGGHRHEHVLMPAHGRHH